MTFDQRRPMMNFDELSPELQKRAQTCKTPEEVLNLAREEGYELSDDELQSISGGMKWRREDKTCSDFAPCPLD
jgi:predicted ribosomally synthesized peptide with nif11-like leader